MLNSIDEEGELDTWFNKSVMPFYNLHKGAVYDSAIAEAQEQYGVLTKTCAKGTACRTEKRATLKGNLETQWKTLMKNFKTEVKNLKESSKGEIIETYKAFKKCADDNPCCQTNRTTVENWYTSMENYQRAIYKRLIAIKELRARITEIEIECPEVLLDVVDVDPIVDVQPEPIVDVQPEPIVDVQPEPSVCDDGRELWEIAKADERKLLVEILNNCPEVDIRSANPGSQDTPLIQMAAFRDWPDVAEAIIRHPKYASDVLLQRKTCFDQCKNTFQDGASITSYEFLEIIVDAAIKARDEDFIPFSETIDQPWAGGKTPIWMVANKGKCQKYELLRDAGADMTTVFNGKSVLEAAEESGCEEPRFKCD